MRLPANRILKGQRPDKQRASHTYAYLVPSRLNSSINLLTVKDEANRRRTKEGHKAGFSTSSWKKAAWGPDAQPHLLLCMIATAFSYSV